MVKTKKSKKRANKAIARRRPALNRSSPEADVLEMITNPCSGRLAHGFTLGTEGIVQRFVRYLTAVATTETTFAIIFDPNNHVNNAGIYVAIGAGAGTTAVFTGSAGPGEGFLDVNADFVGVNGACLQALYTGTLVNRKGYIGVCQAPTALLGASGALGTATFADLMTLCQEVRPVPAHSVDVKYAPTLAALTANKAALESSASVTDNCLMIVGIGVNPTDFTFRATVIAEYTPKFALGLPALRPTRTVPPGAVERVTTTLDRLGHWWHNLGDAAGAAMRMGASAYYGLEQGVRLARGVPKLAEAATGLLALVG